MKAGNFVCMGNPEKLKVQFSEGYDLQISFKKPIYEGDCEPPLRYENIGINELIISINRLFKI